MALSADADGMVVTGEPIAPGAPVSGGSVVLVVQGRPVFALASPFPLYRDLHEGDSGPDVGAVQAFLRSVGFSIRSSEESRMGPDTLRSVADLYRRAGFDPPTEIQTIERAPVVSPVDGSAIEVPPVERRVTYVSERELAAFRDLPALLVSAPAVGQRLAGAATGITVACGPIVAKASIPASSSTGVAVGQAAVITVPGTELRAKVTAVVDTPEGITVRLTTDQPLASVPAGQDFLCTIRVRVIATSALLVPRAALSTGGDGSRFVTKAVGTHRLERVRVKVLGTLAGEAAVRPAGDDLRPGDRVKVG